MDAKIGWWAGTTDEFFEIGGPFDTRDEAIKAGMDYRDGEPFWIVRASPAEWKAPDASSVIDEWAMAADDLFFEDGFPGFDGGADAEKAAEEDLQRVLNEWMERHRAILPAPTVFGYRELAEHIVPDVRQGA